MAARTAAPKMIIRDGEAVDVCKHCGADVIKNYDGIGTGYSHLYDEDSPLYLSSGEKNCQPR